MYAAKVSSVFKKVVAEILGAVDAQVAQAQHLQEKKDGKIHEKRIGKE